MNAVTVPRSSLQRSLDRRLDAALRGQESVYLVAGDAGSGKTQLIQQFASEAQTKRDNLLVAYSACNAITGITDAYMPFREILQRLSGDVDESLAEGTASFGNVSRLREFMQTSARALIENGPDLIDVFVPGGALITRLSGKVAQRWAWFDKLASQVSADKPQHLSMEIGQDNIVEQYTRVIEAISTEAPLLLIIDDLHWSDQASLGLLFQLARRLVNNQVFILGATRPPDNSTEMRELGNLVNELRRYFGDVVLDLSAQPAERFIDEYLQAVGFDSIPGTTELLVKQTGGNPLFVVELFRQIAPDNGMADLLHEIESGRFPARLSGIFDRLFSALDDADRQILATASVQGYEFWAELIADANNDSPLAIVRRLGGTLQRDRNIVVDAGPLELESGTVSRFRFRHDLLREYVYQSLTDSERRLSHQAVALQMERRTMESLEDYCVVLADQFEKAHDWSKSIRYRIMAAEKMERTCAPKEAASHYAKALELGTNKCKPAETKLFELHLRLSSQLALAGEYSQADEVARTALASVAGTGQAAVAWLAVGNIARRHRDYATALAALEQGNTMLPPADTAIDVERLKIDLLLEKGIINYYQKDRVSLAATNQALAEIIEAHGAPHQKVSFFNSRSRQALVENNFSPHSDAISFSRKALDAASPPSPGTVFGLGFAKLWQENFEGSIEVLEEANDKATKHGGSIVRLQSLIYLSFAHRRSGNTEAVDKLLMEISAVLEFVKVPEYPAVLSAQKSWLAYRDGDTDNAFALAQSATRYWRENKSAYPFLWLADWVTLATADPGSAESIAAVDSMLSPEQAWQRASVIDALKAYSDDNVRSRECCDAVVRTAKEGMYL